MTVYCGRCGCPFDPASCKGRCPECRMNTWSTEPGPLTEGWRRRQEEKPMKQGNLFTDQEGDVPK